MSSKFINNVSVFSGAIMVVKLWSSHDRALASLRNLTHYSHLTKISLIVLTREYPRQGNEYCGDSSYNFRGVSTAIGVWGEHASY